MSDLSQFLYGNGNIKSVQRGVLTFTTSTSATAGISAVNLSNAVVIVDAQCPTDATGGAGADTFFARLALTTTTQVTGTIGTAPGSTYPTKVYFTVIEFKSLRNLSTHSHAYSTAGSDQTVAVGFTPANASKVAVFNSGYTFSGASPLGKASVLFPQLYTPAGTFVYYGLPDGSTADLNGATVTQNFIVVEFY